MNSRSPLLVFCTSVLFCINLSAFAADSAHRENSDISVSAEIAALRETAQGGSAESQYMLGELFEYGRGVQQNDSKAAYWYELAATQDFASAQYRLAILYDNGWGSPVNKEKAYSLYKAAAENGVELAQHDLAISYYQGSGTDKSLLQAYKWLRVAELNGSTLMQKHLKLVAAEMSAVEIEAAENLAVRWIEQNQK